MNFNPCKKYQNLLKFQSDLIRKKLCFVRFFNLTETVKHFAKVWHENVQQNLHQIIMSNFYQICKKCQKILSDFYVGQILFQISPNFHQICTKNWSENYSLLFFKESFFPDGFWRPFVVFGGFLTIRGLFLSVFFECPRLRFFWNCFKIAGSSHPKQNQFKHIPRSLID